MGASTNPEHPKRFVIGLDFGTTFTSVAFAHSDFPDEVKLVDRWPNGRAGVAGEQVPTELLYKDPVMRENVWGYGVPKSGSSSASTLKWFKLLLQESQPAGRSWMDTTTDSVTGLFRNLGIRSSSYTPPTETPANQSARVLEEIELLPTDAVEDFLKNVRALTIETIGRTFEAEFVGRSTLEWVISIPAIWSDKAKDRMIRAAGDAGFVGHNESFHLVSEPEAAAAHTLKVVQPNCLKHGDTFVICDAGGGTVDLISYKIQQLKPLIIGESVSGTGDLCGSVFLDARFQEYMKDVIGEQSLNSMLPSRRAMMLQSWENMVKPSFGNGTEDEFEIHVPGIPDDPDKKIEQNVHIMTNGDVQKIFDPVVQRVVELVREQIADVRAKGDSVVAVLLVGGFGSSEYLRDCIERGVNATQSSLAVLQPVNARTAIARGALLQGLDGSAVKEKRARRHYGCVANTSSFDHEDSECFSRKYWCAKDERWKVHKRLAWHVKKNDIFSTAHTSHISFYRLIDVEESNIEPDESFVFTTTLFACDSDSAPDYAWRAPESVYEVCKIETDLSGIPVSKFPIKEGTGKEYYLVNFDLKLTVVGEIMTFELEFEGKSYGKAVAKFE